MRKETLQHNIIMDNKIAIHSHFKFHSVLYFHWVDVLVRAQIYEFHYFAFSKEKRFHISLQWLQVYRIVRSGKTHIHIIFIKTKIVNYYYFMERLPQIKQMIL